MVHRIMVRVKWGRRAVDFLRIVNGAESALPGRVYAPGRRETGLRDGSPSGLCAPRSPQRGRRGGGAQGRSHRHSSAPNQKDSAGAQARRAHTKTPCPRRGKSGAMRRAGGTAGTERARSPKGTSERPHGRTRRAKPAPAAQRGQPQGRPERRKGKGKRSGRSERRGSATARTKPERRSGGSERRTRVEWARPPAADEPRKRSAARRQDARWDKAPATAQPTRRDEREPGQARKTALWSAGNLPARELAGWVGAICPRDPTRCPRINGVGAAGVMGLRGALPPRRSLRAWCALQSLRRRRHLYAAGKTAVVLRGSVT